MNEDYTAEVVNVFWIYSLPLQWLGRTVGGQIYESEMESPGSLERAGSRVHRLSYSAQAGKRPGKYVHHRTAGRDTDLLYQRAHLPAEHVYAQWRGKIDTV